MGLHFVFVRDRFSRYTLKKLICKFSVNFFTILVPSPNFAQYYSRSNFEIRRDVTSGRTRISGEETIKQGCRIWNHSKICIFMGTHMKYAIHHMRIHCTQATIYFQIHKWPLLGHLEILRAYTQQVKWRCRTFQPYKYINGDLGHELHLGTRKKIPLCGVTVRSLWNEEKGDFDRSTSIPHCLTRKKILLCTESVSFLLHMEKGDIHQECCYTTQGSYYINNLPAILPFLINHWILKLISTKL